MKDIIERCNLDYSFQQRLFEIYKILELNEIRGFVMTVFSYAYLTAEKNGNVYSLFQNILLLRFLNKCFVSETYAGELRNAVAKLVLRSRDYIAEFTSVATDASREILLCGAENHITGKCYILI